MEQISPDLINQILFDGKPSLVLKSLGELTEESMVSLIKALVEKISHQPEQTISHLTTRAEIALRNAHCKWDSGLLEKFFFKKKEEMGLRSEIGKNPPLILNLEHLLSKEAIKAFCYKPQHHLKKRKKLIL
jgi:hypothetical protein